VFVLGKKKKTLLSESNFEDETRILDPRPKFLGFHMSGLVTCPNMPNKKTR
jgi:hypothetical protein